jgi:double-strand break repair protein MRE11
MVKLWINLILGSSIATSLCEAESKPKHVGLLEINKTNFRIKKLELKSVRPFIFENMILRDHDIKIGNCVSLADSVSQYVDQYIENELMPKVVKQLTGISYVLTLIHNRS